MFQSILVSALQKCGLPIMLTCTRTSRILGQLKHKNKHFQRSYKSCFILPFQSSSLLCNSNKIFLQQTSNKLLHTYGGFSFTALTSGRSLSPFYSRNCSQNIELSDEEKKKRQLIMLEHCNYIHEGLISCKELTELQMRALVQIPHLESRRKQLLFYDQKESIKLRDKQIQQDRKVDKITVELELEDFDGTMEFIRIYKAMSNRYYDDKLVRAMMFGQSLVIDFDYERLMSPKEMGSLALQTRELFSVNKKHFDPFNLHFVNFRQGYFSDILVNYLIDYENIILNIHTDDYLNHFPKERLVYLSPDAPIEMDTYDHDAIYILGGIVDMSQRIYATYDKANQQKIQMRRLPLDKYVKWGSGGKNLNMIAVVSILLDLKETDDWEFALRHIPERKLKPDQNNHVKRIMNDEVRQQIRIPRTR